MLVRHIEWTCHCCGHHVSAMTEAGLKDAMDAHSNYVNDTADRRTDPHFLEIRMDALITDGR